MIKASNINTLGNSKIKNRSDSVNRVPFSKPNTYQLTNRLLVAGNDISDTKQAVIAGELKVLYLFYL